VVGFFDKMLHSDVFVLLDTVQFIKRGYQNRNPGQGPLRVTVAHRSGRHQGPLRPADQGRSDRRVRPTGAGLHLRTLRTVLAKAPYLDELCDCVEPAYQPDGASKLAEFNMVLIRLLAGRLGIRTRLVLASELGCGGQSHPAHAQRHQGGGRRRVPVRADRAGLPATRAVSTRPASRCAITASSRSAIRSGFGDFLPGLSCLDYLAKHGLQPLGLTSDSTSDAYQRRCPRGAQQPRRFARKDAEGPAEPPALPRDRQYRRRGLLGRQRQISEQCDVHHLEWLLDQIQRPPLGQVEHPVVTAGCRLRKPTASLNPRVQS